MKVLDRYLVRTIIVPLAASLVALLTIWVLVDSFERLDTFIDHGVRARTVAKYYIGSLPALFVLILPISTLIGVLFGLGGMARRNELIALTANGIGLGRILRPVLSIGIVGSVVGFVFTAHLAPLGNNVADDIYDYDIKERPRISGSSRRDLTHLGSGGRFFLVRRFEGDSGTMEDIVIQQFANGTLVHRIDAERATWEGDGWVFRKGFVRHFGERGMSEIEPFDERRFPQIKETPRDFLRVVKKPEAMTLLELREHIRRTRFAGGDVTKLLVEEQMRWSFPAASFIVILLGAPLTGAIRRGGHALGFGLALAVAFSYYVLLQIGETFGHSGTFPPVLSAWLPNLTFLALGAVGLWKTPK